MYSVWYFNKLYLQNFLNTRHYSVGIFNELWLRKEASYCWPGLFYKRARFLRDTLPGRTGADMPLELSLTHSVSLCDGALVVRECACTLPSSWKQWSFSSSGAAQEMLPWPHNVWATHLSWLEVLFNYYTVNWWVFINVLIIAWNDLLVYTH